MEVSSMQEDMSWDIKMISDMRLEDDLNIKHMGMDFQY
mgnify:CR=1 FL=1